MRHGTHSALLLRSHISKLQWRPLVRVMFVTTNSLGRSRPSHAGCRSSSHGPSAGSTRHAPQSTSGEHLSSFLPRHIVSMPGFCSGFADSVCAGGKITYHGGHHLVHQSSRIEADSSLWQPAKAKSSSHLSSSTCRNTEYLCYQYYPPPTVVPGLSNNLTILPAFDKTAIPARGGRFFHRSV